LSDFATEFGRPPDAAAFAPARVNLIGEHTDYNGGLVLPMALPLGTTAEIALRTDGDVRARSASLPPASAEARYRRGAEAQTRGWIDYVQGVTQALDRRGLHVPGFDLRVQSTVPLGGGLASSASLEVAVARALRAACGLALDDVALALVPGQIGQ
jgi:galactokinase